MLQKEYKILITELLTATEQSKIKWLKDESPNAFYIESNPTSKILIDNYYSQSDSIVNSCINMTIFNLPVNKILDEIVVCDKTTEIEDFSLINKLYQLVRKQYSDQGINPALTAITESIRHFNANVH